MAKQIVLITGANSGLGYGIAELLLADETKHVLLGCRSEEKGRKALSDLQSLGLPGTVELLLLDVSKVESVNAAAESVQKDHGKLDCLINNAAIASFPDSIPLDQQMDAAFRTNVTGSQMMVDAFAPLLEKNAEGTPARIIAVTSGAGSVGRRLSSEGAFRKLRYIPYRSSKAAFNMITAGQAVEFEDKNVKVFLYCPGYTVSNLSPTNTAEKGAKPTKVAAAPVVKMVNGSMDGSCIFGGDVQRGYLHCDEDGSIIEYPW